MHNLASSPLEQSKFVELSNQILTEFIQGEDDEYHFGGYAVELYMYKTSSVNYDIECSMLSLQEKVEYEGWAFVPSKNHDDDCYIIKDGVLLKHHLFSFLWFKN